MKRRGIQNSLAPFEWALKKMQLLFLQNSFWFSIVVGLLLKCLHFWGFLCSNVMIFLLICNSLNTNEFAFEFAMIFFSFLFSLWFQAEVTVGGLQSFPLDESSVYNYHSSHGHHKHNHSNGQPPQQQSSSGGASPSPAASAANHKVSGGVAVQAEASKESLSNVSSPSRSHRRMVSAPHVPKRTVSKLTSMENNAVNLNNNSTSVKQHQSPSRRVTPVTSQGT